MKEIPEPLIEKYVWQGISSTTIPMSRIGTKVFINYFEEWQLSTPKNLIDLLDLLQKGDLVHCITHQIGR